MIESMIRDLRIAARGLRRNPGLTAVAIVTLALGIGATTGVFSVVYGVLVRPLPFPNADRLVQIVQLLEQPAASPRREPARAGLTPHQFVDLQARTMTLAALGRYSSTSATLTGRGDPVRLIGAAIAPSFFGGLGVRPLLGRTLVDEDAVPGAEPTVVLNHRMWRTYFGEDPSVLDSRIPLGDTPRRVVGVMPPGFGFPSIASSLMSRNSAGELDDAPEYWVAIAPFVLSGAGRGTSYFETFALLRPGVGLEQAEAEVRSLVAPAPNRPSSPLELVNAREEMGREVSRALLIFCGTISFALAAIGLYGLLAYFVGMRTREFGIRMALGADQRAILRGVIGHGIGLAGAGMVIGLAGSFAVTQSLESLLFGVTPRDSATFALAAALFLVAAIAASYVPSRRATHVDPVVALRAE